MTRCGQGDEDALEALYHRYGPTLLGLVHHLTNARHEAEDVLQLIFLAIWRQAAAFNAQRGSARSWIYQVARSRIIDWSRSRRQKAFPLAEPPEEAGEDSDPTIPLTVSQALNSLSQGERVCVELAYFGGFTQEEISAILGVPLGSVKARVRRGLEKMRRWWNADGSQKGVKLP